MDNRVRIALDWQGERQYFVRMDADRPFIVPVDRLRNAALLTRETAVAVCQKLRERGWQASIVTPGGTTLYEEQMPHSPVSQNVADRVPMHVGDVLIVAGNPPRRGYYIRFPQTAFESLWGETAEAAYEALTGHPQYVKLKDYAERYVEPAQPLADPQEVERRLQFERHGRIRPGSL